MVHGPYAPSGTRLPGVPRLKSNIVSRYTQPFDDFKVYGQAAVVYQDASVPLLFPAFYQKGPKGSSIWVSCRPTRCSIIATASEHNGMQLEVRVDNVINTLGELTRFAACTPTTCNQPYVIPVQPRTVWLQFGQKF